MNSATGESSIPDLAPTSSLSRLTDPYLSLPEAIRWGLTRKQWLWLSDAEKASLTQNATEPEWIRSSL